MTADEKYSAALRLYRDTDRSITDICRECGVSRNGFASYIQRHHRDLMFARHGVTVAEPGRRMRKPKGQTPETHAKYKAAIEACDSEEFIHLNVSQIARRFNLDGTALNNQLKTHYPEILERREKERQLRGIADNFLRGARKSAVDTYADAVELLRKTDKTIEEVAEACGISFTGLRQHILLYHKDLVDLRRRRRKEGKRLPKVGRVSGNGRIRRPDEEYAQRFARALDLYRSSSLPVKDICAATGTDMQAFKNHLRMWHKDLMFKRRGAEMPAGASDRASLDGVKRSDPRAAEKYAGAIAELKAGKATVEATARKYGFTPEVFRAYLKEHCPKLWREMGMTELPNGRKVLRRSYERYAAAIEAYETSTESLRSIASRLGLTYNSVAGFIRRNLPEAIERHNRLESSESTGSIDSTERAGSAGSAGKLEILENSY